MDPLRVGSKAAESSDDEHNLPSAKRQKRHKFKTFAQRVKEVDVDVYRNLGHKRAEPLPGSSSFFQERLNAWKELNAARDWLEAASELHQLSITLPQLLHHQKDILQSILSRITLEAALSLEPLLDLLGALARDLQEDFLPHIDLVLASFIHLVNSGADREPEILENIFKSTSQIFKYLSPYLTSDVTPVFRSATPLLYHKARHVRVLAAESLGYLLRHASHAVSRSALRRILADVTINPSVACTNGAGLLFAEAIRGVGHGVHSRGHALLALLFSNDIVTADDFASPSLHEKRKGKEKKNQKDGKEKKALTTDIIEARMTAVAIECLDHVLDYVRRGSAIQPLWDAILEAVHSRFDSILLLDEDDDASNDLSLENGTPKNSNKKRKESTAAPKKSTAELFRSAARSLALLSHMIEYYRGSRVEDYAPLFALSKKVSAAEYANTPIGDADTLHTLIPTARDDNGGDGGGENAPLYLKYTSLTLSSQILCYYKALVYSHCKVTGASHGPGSIEQVAPLWCSFISRVPCIESLDFIRGLMVPPASYTDIIRYFAPHALSIVGKCLLPLGEVNGVDANAHGGKKKKQEKKKVTNDTMNKVAKEEEEDIAWPLLMDLCSILGRSSNVPVILTAAYGIGNQIAKMIIDKIDSFSLRVSSNNNKNTAKTTKQKNDKGGEEEEEGEEMITRRSKAVWAAVYCLPHAVSKPQIALDHLERLLLALTEKTTEMHTSVVLLHCTAAVSSARLAQHVIMSIKKKDADISSSSSSFSSSSEILDQCTRDALSLLRHHPHEYHAVHAAADIFSIYISASPSALVLLDASLFEELATLLAPNLSSPSAAMREATLRVLCTFEQPRLLLPSSSSEHQQKHQQHQQQQQPCDILHLILSIENRSLSSDSGRRAVVILGRIRNYLEYKKVPPILVPLLVRSLLGILHIRYYSMWQATASALAAALESFTDLAWPLVFAALSSSQKSFLSGEYQTKAHALPKIDVHSARQATTGTVSLDTDDPNEMLPSLKNNNESHGRLVVNSDIEKHRILSERFSAAIDHGSTAVNGGSTDASVRMTYLLKCLGETDHNVVESKTKDWAPLFLMMSSAKTADGIRVGTQGIEEEEESEEESDDEHDAIAVVVNATTGNNNTTSSSSNNNNIVSVRSWRIALLEWLTVISRLKGIRGASQAVAVRTAVASHIQDIDPTIQQAALKCLKTYKLVWLAPYLDRLLRLADNKTLRAELASFPLAVHASSVRIEDDVGSIAIEHRRGLVPLVSALLFPKMRKRSGRLGGKGAPGSARSAILNFLSGAQPSELSSVLELFLAPLDPGFKHPSHHSISTTTTTSTTSPAHSNLTAKGSDDNLGITQKYWWARHLGKHSTDGSFWLNDVINANVLNSQPLRRRIGYLNALDDLITHLGHQLQDYFPELLSITLVLFEGTAASVGSIHNNNNNDDDDANKDEDAKEVRIRSLRLLASVLDRFPDSIDYSFLWPRLFSAIQPMIERIAIEVSAEKAPASVELCLALASSPALASVFIVVHDTINDHGDDADGATMSKKGERKKKKPAKEPVSPSTTQPHPTIQASNLLAHCIDALSSSACAEPTRNAMLSALESILDMPEETAMLILHPHTGSLLRGLQSIVTAVWKSGGQPRRKKSALLKNHVGNRSGGSNGNGKGGGSTIPRRGTAKRALALLELLASRTSSIETSLQLTQALLPLLKPEGSSRGKKRVDEELVGRSLAVLTALWSHMNMEIKKNYPITATHLSEKTATTTTKKKKDSSNINEDVSNLQLFVENHRDIIHKVLSSLPPLISSLAPRNARDAVCAAFTTMSSFLPSELGESAALLSDLNSWSPTEVDEADYDRRMKSYRKLSGAFWTTTSILPGAALLQQCARDLRNADDIALRHAASQALSHLVHAAKSVAAVIPITTTTTTTTTEVPPCIALVQHHLFARLTQNIAASNLAVRQEHLSLVRLISLNLPTLYPDLQSLTEKDEEIDFWLNASHLQLHRRARAFARLSRFIADESSPMLPVSVSVGLILPLLQQAIVEGRAVEDIGPEAKQIDRDREANVVDCALSALSSIARSLPWIQYQQLLGQYLRLMARTASDEASTTSKQVLRAVCAVLDAFHFLDDVSEADVCGDADGADIIEEEEEEEEEDQEEEDEEEEETDNSAPSLSLPLPQRDEIYRFLQKRVVPELRSQLVSRGAIRAPVAHALIKVLKLFPEALMRTELPRTLQLIANLLKLRAQNNRDSARAVMVSIAKELGPEYLTFIIEVVKAALPDRGYTAHVLGFTMHSILEGIAPYILKQPGSIDDCLPLLLPIVEADLFGDVADAKEVDAFAASYREAKKCKANESYQILASVVTFSTCIPRLLGPIRDRLHEASKPKIRTKLSLLLQHASRGILTNPTATPKDICELVYAVVTAGVHAETAAKEKAAAASGAAVLSSSLSLTATDPGALAALHQHLLVEFALTTLQSALKKGVVPTTDSTIALLDPLLPLLVDSLTSRHAPNVTASLQCLSILIQARLPGMNDVAPTIGKSITHLLKRCPKTTHPIAQDCFKLLAGMLRRCEEYAPSQGQLRFLLGWAFTDLEESAERQTAFTLLRAILARKLVLPEVYDLMNRVQELMVQSHSSSVRQLAAASLLQFLLEYPLGTTRLQQHVQFLLTNVGYDHEQGRLAALEMLDAVITKFPEEVVSSWAEMIFLPLVTRLVNDASSKCRTFVATCLAHLINAINPSAKERLSTYCNQWLCQVKDMRLVRTSAQVLGIFFEVEGSRVAARRMQGLLPSIAELLMSRVELDQHMKNSDDTNTDTNNGIPTTIELADALAHSITIPPSHSASMSISERNAPGWQEAYYCLVLLEKVLQIAPEQLHWSCTNLHVQHCWTASQKLILHRHAWVRKAAARFLGAGLAINNIGPHLVVHCTAGVLASSFFQQLDSSVVDESMAGQAVKCLVFLTLFMYDDDKKAGKIPPLLAVENQQQEEEKEKEENEEEENEEEENEEEENEEEENELDNDIDENTEEQSQKSFFTLNALVRNMSRLADDKSFTHQLHRKTALRFIAATASRLGKDRVKPYLPLLLRPLYRITETGSIENNEEISQLASEIMDHLRSLVGSDVLLSAYNAARTSVRGQRSERKRKAAVLAMVDPEAAAKRKIRASERKAAGKRKAVEEVKRKRAAGVYVKNRKGGGRFQKKQRAD